MFSSHALTQSVKEAMQIKNYWIYHRVDKKKKICDHWHAFSVHNVAELLFKKSCRWFLKNGCKMDDVTLYSNWIWDGENT